MSLTRPWTVIGSSMPQKVSELNSVDWAFHGENDFLERMRHFFFVLSNVAGIVLVMR